MCSEADPKPLPDQCRLLHAAQLWVVIEATPCLKIRRGGLITCSPVTLEAREGHQGLRGVCRGFEMDFIFKLSS